MVYRESVNLIGSFTVFHLLIVNSCEQPMKIVLLSILTNYKALNFKLYITNFKLYITKLPCTSRAVFETFELSDVNTINHFFLNVTLHFYAMRPL